VLKIQDKTHINIGNGLNTPFYEAKWLQGVSSKEMAPDLFRQIRYKRRTIYFEMHNYNWIRNIQNIDSSILIHEFLMLFVALDSVELTNQRD
jgi:hypothetical protein